MLPFRSLSGECYVQYLLHAQQIRMPQMHPQTNSSLSRAPDEPPSRTPEPSYDDHARSSFATGATEDAVEDRLRRIEASLERLEAIAEQNRRSGQRMDAHIAMVERMMNPLANVLRLGGGP